MSLASALKCLFCLIKCSKYIYFIKKAICITALILTVIAGFSILSDEKGMIKKLKEMI